MARRRNQATSLLPSKIITICAEAQKLCRRGHYEAAADSLAEIWPGVMCTPDVSELPPNEAAQVLLIAGLLTAQLGNSRGLDGAQERAKDLLTESQRLFELTGDSDGVAEALSAQGYCCNRAGSYDDARVFLEQALTRLSPSNRLVRAEALMRLAWVASREHQPQRALDLLEENYSLFNLPTDPDLRRMFHCCYSGHLTWRLRQTESQHDARRVLDELRIAKELCVEARHNHYLMMVENNSAIALMYLHSFEEAHARLDDAEALAGLEGRPDWLLSLRETRTQVLSSEGRLDEAERLIAQNIAAIESGEHKGLLCESLTTQGIILSEAQKFEDARTSFLRAIEVGEFTGDLRAVARAGEQLHRIAKLTSIAHPRRAPRFIWKMSNDSMDGAGIHAGRYYWFRQSAKWRDGDIAAVTTSDGRHYIGYIYAAAHNMIRLEWGNEEYKPQYHLRNTLTVNGVIDV